MLFIKTIVDGHRASAQSIPNVDYILGDEEAIPIPRQSADCACAYVPLHPWTWGLDLELLQTAEMIMPSNFALCKLLKF